MYTLYGACFRYTYWYNPNLRVSVIPTNHTCYVVLIPTVLNFQCLGVASPINCIFIDLSEISRVCTKVFANCDCLLFLSLVPLLSTLAQSRLCPTSIVHCKHKFKFCLPKIEAGHLRRWGVINCVFKVVLETSKVCTKTWKLIVYIFSLHLLGSREGGDWGTV